MGCGCGKKAIKPTSAINTISYKSTSDTLKSAQVYQSATIQSAPQAPVLRKTV